MPQGHKNAPLPRDEDESLCRLRDLEEGVQATCSAAGFYLVIIEYQYLLNNYFTITCVPAMETSLFFKAALAADALSAASHWTCQRGKLFGFSPGDSSGQLILSANGAATACPAPPADAARLTHLGEQMRWLQQALTESGTYDTNRWREHWLEGMRAYEGHIDAASSFTLEQDGLWPSRSDDIGGAARIAPLLDLHLGVEETIRAARCQSALTHGDPGVADCAEFFVRATCAIRSGIELSEALFLAAASGNYQQLPSGEMLAAALSTDPDDLEGTACQFGTLGAVHEAFPLILYLAERPVTDFRGMLDDNARIGGETCARAMLLALLFAARDGSSVLDDLLLESVHLPEKAASGGSSDLARSA